MHITVIYEQSCYFCNWCRRFVERRSSDITFIGYDSPEAQALLRDYPKLYALRTKSIIVYEPNRHPTTKFKACRCIARHMHRPWPTINTALGIIPTFLGDIGYDLIARARPFLSRLVRTGG